MPSLYVGYQVLTVPMRSTFLSQLLASPIINATTFMKNFKLSVIAAGVAASGALAMVLPAIAQAQTTTATTTHTYAYVNQAQEVSMVMAANWMDAIATAPNIDAHSGVLLIK